MRTFYIGCRVENIAQRERGVGVQRLLVDTGSEYTWIPERTLESIGVERGKKDVAFVMANGTRITRSVGFALSRVEQAFTVDEVVFAEPADLLLLGSRTLEGLNLTVDPRREKLTQRAIGPADEWSRRLARHSSLLGTLP